MYRSTAYGYEVEWDEYQSTYSRMMYDGVQFHRVLAIFDMSRMMLLVSTQVTPYSPNNSSHRVVCINAEFSPELLNEFGLDVLDSKVTKEEDFILKLIKITSQMGYWSNKMNTFLANNTTNISLSSNTAPVNTSNKTNNSHPHSYKPFNVDDFESIIRPASLKDQLRDKDELIKELRMEIQDLKDEIETLKAIALDA